MFLLPQLDIIIFQKWMILQYIYRMVAKVDDTRVMQRAKELVTRKFVLA